MASSRFDPQPPARSGAAADNAVASEPQVRGQDEHDDASPPADSEFLSVIARAQSISKDYQVKTVDRPLGRAYRAWQNQHAEGSKYLGPAFKGRSRLFVPKTRTAVRKNLAAAAGALFATEDVTSISATFEDDPQQRATAATLKADLEYRLTRSSAISGLPWFQIAMGACLDSQLTGVCLTKQFWEYEEVLSKDVNVVSEYLINPQNGQPEIGEDGQPIIIEYEEPVYRVTKDRPMVELHPIENAGIDPAAPWHSPVQLGRWFYMRYPMGLSDAMAMIRSANKRGDKMWRDGITEDLLRKGRNEDERSANRRVREGGGDRYEDAGRAGGALDLVWLQENFVRIDGRDWHFWSVDRFGLLSDPRETIEAYPEFGGERPYHMGVSQLDTHRVFPQSPVETWAPLQHELNDITNLRLDTLKRAIAPLTLAKRGKNVDLQALQRRGQPENIVMVDSVDDVSFVSTQAPSGAAFQETSITNANFDELAGVFSTSSVQSSRQLNETVGGMNLMSRAAGSVSEFDLRIWIETWVEPVLRHLVHLVRYYETDERIVAVAGQQAHAWSRYKYLPNVDDFEQCEMTVRVNAGIGTVDPMQKLQKMKFAFEMLAPILPEAAKKGISINVEQIIEEVMGSAGFRDGRRFFEFGEAPQDTGPPPEIMVKMKELELKQQRNEAEREKWMREIDVKLEAIRSGERQSAADNEAVINAAEVEWTGRHALDAMKLGASAEQATAANENVMRRDELQSAERYRMEQWKQSQANQTGQAKASTGDPVNANGQQIIQLMQELVRQFGVLAQKVTAQEEMLGSLAGRGSPAPAVMQ